MTKKEQLKKALDESLDATNGKATPDPLIKMLLDNPTSADPLAEINLRLKQLVALKVLESIQEGHNLFYDFDLADETEDFDGAGEAIERERILNDEARERYQQEFNDATKALDELKEKRGN